MTSKELIPRPAVQPPAVIAAPPWEQPKKRDTESGLRLAFRSVRRNTHLSVPLTAPVALLALGLVLHVTHSARYAAIVGAVLAAAVWYFAPHKWTKGNGEPQHREVWYARLSALLAALWLWLAAWLGPVTGMPGLVLAAVLLAAGGTWGFFWWRHKRPRGQRKRDALIAKWDAWWQSHCWHWNLGGSAIVNVWVMGVTVKAEVAGLAGRHSIHYVNQVLHLIESGLDGMVDVGRVRAETVPKRPNHFYLYFKQANPLAEIVEYDMSIAPRSVHDPAPLGITETGSWRMASLRQNSFVLGATRSGKTNHLLVRFAHLSGCPDDRQVIIALKGGRSARPALEAGIAEYVITTVDEARMYLLMCVTEINARGTLAYTGDDQLHATAEVPAIHTLFDEIHGLTSVTNGDADCSRYVATYTSQGSGVEMYAEIDTQYGSLEESVRTEQTRMNLRLRVVFRVEMASHGQFALEDWSKLDASKLEELGTCYAKDGPKAPAEQLREPHMPHDLFKRITAQNAAMIGERPPLRLFCGDQMSPAGVTWQEWWDRRWLRLHPAFQPISPQYQAAVAEFGTEPAQEPGHAPEPIAPPPSTEPGTGDGRSAAARIDAELDAAAVPDGWTPPKVNLAPVIAQKKAAFATALAGAPERGGITPQQLTAESGMSRSWTQQMLARLAQNDAVTQLSRGLYVPAPGTDILAAIRAVQASDEKLLGEAQRKINAA
jgi:hypothetical protein